MLVLSRRVNESIIIDNNITITVVDMGNGKVRLGIEAPKDVPVYRKEVWDSIRSEGEHSPKSLAERDKPDA